MKFIVVIPSWITCTCSDECSNIISTTCMYVCTYISVDVLSVLFIVCVYECSTLILSVLRLTVDLGACSLYKCGL